MSGAGDTQPNEHPGPGPIGEFPAGGADAPLELFEGDPLLPYLAPQALDRRLTGRFGDRALLGHAPNCQTALRLMCRDYRFPAILPDFVTPHPLLRPDNLVSGRMLDYAMADPTGYTELEAWKGLVQDVLSSHPGPGNPP